MKKLLSILITFSLSLAVNSQTLNLGVITDFEKSAEIDSLLVNAVEEIKKTIGPAKQINLDIINGVYYGVNDLNTAKNEYQGLSESHDFILLFGSNSIKGAINLKSFAVPTIGLGVIDPHLQDLPYDNGVTNYDNFSYIWAAKDLEKELSVFKQITPYENLTILVNESSVNTFNEEKGQAYIDSLEEKLSVQIQVLQISDEIRTSLSGVNSDTDAVYLSYLQGKDSTEIKEIAQWLKYKQLPSFSSQKFHVDNGIMACISDKNDFQQVIRKLAIMVDEAVNGESLSQMTVNINFKEDLFLNSSTVNKIGAALSFEVLFTANFIDDEQKLPIYSLEAVMERAIKNNFGIKISNQDVSLAIQDAKLAKSAVLPYLDLGINGRQINEESTFVLFDQPERRLSGQLNLDQVIYSEEAFAGIKIAYYLQKAQESATQAEILQIYYNTFQDYFGVLVAKTSLQIETENLENLKTNLEMARIRVNSGDANRAEILRWESEVSTASQKVVEANTVLFNSKYLLNTSLANTLEEKYDISDITVDDQIYTRFSSSVIAKFVNNPSDLDFVASFLVNESINNNPNKQGLLQQINAVERKNLQDKRLLYTPKVGLQAQMAQVLARGGANSNATDFNIPNNTWSVGIGLSYPIFTGNQRKVNLQTSRIQLDQLNNSKVQLDQQLELAVKSSLTNTVATSTNIAFSKTASNNAIANFELVRDQYQVGEVNITQLVDAQQSSLGAKLRYSVAIYEYLQSQLQLEFSVGFFSMFASEAELQAFNKRFLEYRTKL
ncbi:TolC family protein [Lutimonas sp.]|uniref:TolC family protein n=1 Tax=Lutimonas sp. TaxID=1872403 RepID=UPI003D9BEB13